ncbi:MAG: TIGR02391 family protein [Hydrogenophilaceae bacterium]|jgi:uncharacterized protein (TIGR02391 family)|nr:TIGR02391 family protein [Hydrogenophilaceae bacterium]
MFDAIRKFQEAVYRIGLGAAVLQLPAPRMLALPGPSSGQNTVHENFLVVVEDAEVLAVSRDLFVSGFYSEAVEAAFKMLDEEVRRVSNEGLSGTRLMEKAFSPNGPIIPLNAQETQSEQDEQAGYHRLFAGSMLGIRNPCAHENGWIEDPQIALETIVLCQHLMRKLKASTKYAPKAKAPSP